MQNVLYFTIKGELILQFSYSKLVGSNLAGRYKDLYKLLPKCK